MANRKPNRRANRRKPAGKTNARQINKIYTRIPFTRRRVSSDPRTLPTHIDMAVKVRFTIEYRSTDDTDASSIHYPVTPSAWAQIHVNYEANASGERGNRSARTIPIDPDVVLDSAAVRLFGTHITSGGSAQIQVLRDTTEYAIESLTLYGSAELGTKPIRLSVDFGNGMPGAVGTDAGDRLKRAVVSLRAPQLVWRHVGTTSALDAFAVILVPLPLDATGTATDPAKFREIGVLDATVHVRRSFVEVVPTTIKRIREEVEKYDSKMY